MSVLLSLNDEGLRLKPRLITGFNERESTRVVAFDGEGRIGLLYIKSGDYYGLPGGGLEKGEAPGEAAIREMQEEMGARVTLWPEVIGKTEEHRTLGRYPNVGVKITNYVYGADVVHVAAPNPTRKELEIGQRPVWLPAAQALACMMKEADAVNADSYYKLKFRQTRDVFVLRHVLKLYADKAA